MSLLDLVTGGKTSEASGDIEKALAAIQGVKTPTADEMKFQLQKLVQAGVLTPEQAQTYLQSSNALAQENVDQTGAKAQEEAIGTLLSDAKAGGISPIEAAKMNDIFEQLSSREKGANDAIVQNAAARGTLTGGETMAAQLESNQGAQREANQRGLDTAGQAYQRMLEELTSVGGLGANLQGQENTQANTVAAATNAINQFNAAQQQNTENFNTLNKNQGQQFNLENAQHVADTNTANANQHSQYEAQLPQEVFSDQLQKAGAEAGVNENAAQTATQQGGQQASLIGNLIGTGGEVAASSIGKPKATQAPVAAAHGGLIHEYLSGGKVDGRANVVGDSPKNDTVPAILSPGEVVLPRSVVKQPDRVMEFLNRIRKPKVPIHPEDTAHVLKALSLVRNQP